MSNNHPPHTYLVFLPGSETASVHKANHVAIEPSGALALYAWETGSSPKLMQAYAPGTWRSVEKHQGLQAKAHTSAKAAL